MSSGSWKVAYADFVTAMMAFFLLMWLLNAATEEQKSGLAGYFKAGGGNYFHRPANVIANSQLFDYISTLDKREFVLSEVEQSQYAIAQDLRQFLMQDAIPSQYSGITSDGIGVLLHMGSNVLFEPGSTTFTPEGKQALRRIADIMAMHQTYLVIRGHTGANEGIPAPFRNKWDLSAARANAAVNELITMGVRASALRSVSYADTRPSVPETELDADIVNSRIEFNFHRQEVMSTIVGY